MTRFGLLFTGACIALAIVLGDIAHAQCTAPTQRIRLVVSDGGTGKDTLWFGFSATATAGLDAALCESEFPPFPPAGVFEARFMNPPGYEGRETPAGMGQGFKQDYRRFQTAAQIDTHRIKFQPNEPPGYPVKFKWTRSQVLAMCDSAVIMDEFGGVLIKARMHAEDSLVVTNSAFSSLLLYLYRPHATGVAEPVAGIPTQFGLSQNYPNPFNPSTTIQIAVERQALTNIAIYDVLGRKVVNLLSETLAPGYFNVKWDGTDAAGKSVASGVYYVRMTADGQNVSSFSAVRKLLLMK